MLHDSALIDEEARAVELLLARINRGQPRLEDVWALMDEIWDELGCDNRRPRHECLKKFYEHPVWLLNDLFIGKDEQSLNHRRVVSDWIAAHNAEVRRALDYGGGFGRLACMISEASPGIRVDVFEPFPARYARARARSYPKVEFVSDITRHYDCVVSLDVLEHLLDPISAFVSMVLAIRPGGYLLIGNCFRPVIKCHLPQTFHLRFSFGLIAQCAGLRYEGRCMNTHVNIYRRSSSDEPSRLQLRTLAAISRAAYPLLNGVWLLVSRVVGRAA